MASRNTVVKDCSLQLTDEMRFRILGSWRLT